MIFNEDRISHLAHLMQDRLWQDDLVEFIDEGQALREMKRVLTKYFSAVDEIDSMVRNKIYSQKKNIPEGSRDWDILYKKYFEEELRKKQF
ncbi:MAG: DUF507 family protein [Deltaproteobacteria bacterium]|nr:DUF507 family protein [Deltaproteobacteria bacterium]